MQDKNKADMIVKLIYMYTNIKLCHNVYHLWMIDYTWVSDYDIILNIKKYTLLNITVRVYMIDVYCE